MFSAYYLLFIPLFLCTFNLSANVFLPTFMFVFPLAWIAFIPIVFIEAFVMRKFFKQETFKKLLLLNTLSNALSTFIDIPIAFALYVFLVVISVKPIDALFGHKALPALGFALVSLGILSLFPLFFFVSVWIEKKIMKKNLHTKYDELTIAKAVKQANLASYIFLFIAYIVVWAGFAYYPRIFYVFSFW
jgi:hypothetical protein